MSAMDSCARCGLPLTGADAGGGVCRCDFRFTAVAPAPPVHREGPRETAVFASFATPTRPAAAAPSSHPTGLPFEPARLSRATPLFAAPPPPSAVLTALRATLPPAPASAGQPAPVAQPDPVLGRGWAVREGRPASLRDWDVLAPPSPPPSTGAQPWSLAPPPPLLPAVRARRVAFRLGASAATVALLAVVVAAGWSRGLGTLFTKGLSQPASIGALPLIQTPAAQAVTDAMRAGLNRDAHQVVVGVYGPAGAPQLLFAAAKGGSSETSQQIVADLGNAGLGFDSAAAITPVLGGQQFECGMVAGQSVGAAGVCAWNDGDIDAVILNLGSSDLEATASLAAEARAAAER